MILEQDQRIYEAVTRERSRLRNFIRRRVPDPSEAEDIVQEVFYKLVEANRLLMRLSTRDRLQIQDLLPSPVRKRSTSATCFLNELGFALDELPDEQREVFIAHELEGRSFKEMAAETGVSVNTLLARKRYAVLHLRERLQSIYYEFTKT
jgi:DNA-directed RNA polymerase specialized sigma24 family protein